MHYTCLGWETIDGHRVLKVRLHEARDPQPEPRDYSLDWIDLERGAHPIRHENYANGQLRGRIESGPLAQFPIKGDRKVWLPVGGQEFSYLGKDGISKEPTVEVDYQIVAGTVRLNQGLSDRRFEMGHLPSELNGPLKQARDNYKRAGPEYRSKAAVEQRIDKALEETSRLGLEIEAPSPARTEERQISVFSYAVAGLGLACLVVLLVLWRRR